MDKLFSIAVRGPVEALLTDAEGYRVGHDGTTGKEYAEMFGASYLPYENGYWLLTVLVPQPGTRYTLQLIATGDGPYDFFAMYGDVYGTTGIAGSQGRVVSRERLEFPIDVPRKTSDFPQYPAVSVSGP
jgi:hypothetical protein